MAKFDDAHAQQNGLYIDREAFYWPQETPEHRKARRLWERSQRAAARAKGLKIVDGPGE